MHRTRNLAPFSIFQHYRVPYTLCHESSFPYLLYQRWNIYKKAYIDPIQYSWSFIWLPWIQNISIIHFSPGEVKAQVNTHLIAFVCGGRARRTQRCPQITLVALFVTPSWPFHSQRLQFVTYGLWNAHLVHSLCMFPSSDIPSTSDIFLFSIFVFHYLTPPTVTRTLICNLCSDATSMKITRSHTRTF